jgi:acyl-CoA synthetase (AMP-forming)/AMP-acid ligase II
MKIDPWKLRPMPAALRDDYLRRGWWNDHTLGQMQLDNLAARPDLEFRIWSQTKPQRESFAEVRRLALRFAAGLRARGIKPGDAVGVYVPNSIEGAIGLMSVPLVGAIIVPVAPYYGFRELKSILRRSHARLLVTSESPAGGRLDAIHAMRAELPELEDVYVMDCAPGKLPTGMRAFDQLMADDVPSSLPAVDPDSIAMITFTSGTTSEPKGVVHTHRSICFEVREHMTQMPFPPRPNLVPFPVAHAGGMLGGLFLPPLRGYSVHLMDNWDTGRVLAAMREADLTTGSGTQFFLSEIFAHPDTRPEDLARIGVVAFGGGAVAGSFADQCEAMGIRGQRCYGSSEHPVITMSRMDDSSAKRNHTDGRVMSSCEVRVVDENDAEVPRGTPGELLSRGADLCAGYIDAQANAQSFTPEGWYRSGDIVVQDEDGFVAVVDRVKDIIIRNGVKIGAPEVEDALAALPNLLECAVIAVPDSRTGERTHAMLRLAPGTARPDLDAIRVHLKNIGLAKKKWPESLEYVDDFPRTPLGKIKKFELRNLKRAAAKQ